MRTRTRPAPEREIERLASVHDTDIEALAVQVRAVGRALDALALAIEALAPHLPGGVPASTAEHLEQARWELHELW